MSKTGNKISRGGGAKILVLVGLAETQLYSFLVLAVFEIRLSNLLARKLQNWNIYIDSIEKNLAKATGPNQFSLDMGHRTTAKVDDCLN